MRISIHFDGATTPSVRRLAAELSKVGLRQELQVGCDGPELWSGHTPKMQPWQFAQIIGGLVKFHGEPIGEVLQSILEDDPAVTS